MKSKICALVLMVGAPFFSGCSTQIKNIERAHYSPWEKAYGYTQVVRTGNTLYISGLTSSKSDMESQIKEIYQTLSNILSDYQLTTANVVKETLFTKDIEAVKKLVSVRNQYYPEDNYPASTWVQINRLFAENLLIEVEFIAQMP